MNETKNTCNNAETCNGECPEGFNCPLDNDETLGKNRSSSRRRHHDEGKAKKTAAETLAHVTAKAQKLPDSATPDQHYRAEKKCKNTDKKVRVK